MRNVLSSARVRARSLTPAVALGVVALAGGVTAPVASASSITKSLVNTCKLYGTDGVYTGASVVLNLTISATIPDNIPQGGTGYLSNAKATATLGGPAVGIAHGFGDAFTGSATAFNISLTNASPTNFNAAATPIPIPNKVLPLKKADGTYDALSFDVPTSGFLDRIGPITASGPAQSLITATFPNSPTALVTTINFTTNGSSAVTTYQLRCRPNAFVDENETIPQDLSLGSAKIGDPITFSPNHGPVSGGTLVTVKGVGLGTVSSIVAGGKNVPFTKVSDTELTLVTPPGDAPGPVTVTGTNADGFITATFTYDAGTGPAAPTVSAISPTHGVATGGNVVTITGTNLTGATAVKFGSASATGVTVGSATSLTATVPAGTAGATVPVTVTTPGGTSGSINYAYDAASTTGAPTVTRLLSKTVIANIGGIAVVQGSNCKSIKSVKVGDKAATFTLASTTLMKLTLPKQPAGSYPLVITNTSGSNGPSIAATIKYKPLGS
jgi:hypothetical protein